MNNKAIVSEIKSKLLGLKNKLKNNLIKREISKNLENDSKYDEFDNAINTYIQNIDSLNNFDDEILVGIDARLLRILNNTQSTKSVQVHIIDIIDIINYLMDNQPITHDALNQTISREEFYNRYDNLISLLNPFEKESNLILHTKSENTPFKVFRNSNNQISVLAGEEKSRLSFTKEKLASVIYDNKEIDYHKSYAEVLIEKLLDNTIFDEIAKKHSPLDVILSTASDEMRRIKELEDDKLKMKGQIQELKEQVDSAKNDFVNIKDIIEKASNLEADFNSAKDSVLQNLQLQESYKYWGEQVKSFSKKYWIYLAVSIVLSIALLMSVFYFLEHNPLVVNDVKVKNTELVLIADTNKSNLKTEVKATSFELWRYGFLLLLIAMAVWLIRILIKITLSNYHLSIDANERVVMIRTYLSLLQEGNGFEKEDKKVMLDNIFRPTNFGIIKDESVVTITDLLSSFKK